MASNCSSKTWWQARPKNAKHILLFRTTNFLSKPVRHSSPPAVRACFLDSYYLLTNLNVLTKPCVWDLICAMYNPEGNALRSRVSTIALLPASKE